MEGTAELANRGLIRLLAAEHGMTPTETYTFSSLICGLEISQVVDPLVTARNACPAEYLAVPF